MIPTISRSTKKYLAVLLAVIFVVSFGFSLYYQIRPTTDAKAYDNIAWNLAQGYGYIEDSANRDDPAKDDAIVRVGPGYEFFLAGVYSVFGHQRWIIWLLHALLRVATAYLLFRIALIVFGESLARERIGLLAAGIFGAIPDLIILNGMLLAETLFVALLTVAIYSSLIVLEMGTGSLRAGWWWGLAALVRPTALILTIFFAVYTYITKKRAVLVLFILLIPVVFIGAWSLRNSLLYNTPLFTTTAGSYALWVGNNPDAVGGFDKTPEIQAIRDEHHSVPLSKIATQKYIEFLAHDPVQFLALQIKKTSMYFSLVRPTGFWFFLAQHPIQRFLTLVSSSLATGFLFIVGGAGMYLYVMRKESYRWFLVSTALLQPFSVIPTYVETRYRVPFFPFLALFAAYAVYLFWQSRKEPVPFFYRGLLFSGILIFLLTVGDALYSYDLIIERLTILFNQL